MTRGQPSRRRTGRWWARALLTAVAMASQLGPSAVAAAQDKREPPLRDVRFEWEPTRRLLYLGVSFLSGGICKSSTACSAC